MKLLWWKTRTVQCVDCGYLTLERSGSADFKEMNERFREDPNGGWNQPLLACSRGSCRLAEEERVLQTPTVERARSIRIVMETERVCPRWFLHELGLNPKEHLDLQDRGINMRHTNIRSWVAVGVSLVALGVAIWSQL